MFWFIAAILSLLLLGALAFGAWCWRNISYWPAYMKRAEQAGMRERDFSLPDGSVIRYGEGPDNGPPLLLIHGQTGDWRAFGSVFDALVKRWHVFSVDCYGHGRSSHDPAKYPLEANGEDLITFVREVIGEATVVSGHSSGGLLAAYVAARGGPLVRGAVLEDPPVFSTEPDFFERSWAYQDTFKVMHDYLGSAQEVCFPAYYLRHCLWGRLFMPKAMPKLARTAQRYHERHPDRPVRVFYMPPSINGIFYTLPDYDLQFGESFYDYSWHSGISHAQLMSELHVPTVFVHALEAFTDDGVLMAASTNDQARRAVALMAQGELVELKSGHSIHIDHPTEFVEAINKLHPLG